MTQEIPDDQADYENVFASLALPKTFNLSIAQALVDSGWIEKIEDICQQPKPGELEAYKARRAKLLKREEERKANQGDCDCDIDELSLPE